MKKLLLTTVALTALFGDAAFATNDPNYPGAVQKGTGSPFVSAETGIPIILPFVSDRTARRYAPRTGFQPGPFHESGPDDKVEWRR
jgi:hypothetical protein